MYPIYFICFMLGHVLMGMFKLRQTKKMGISYLKKLEKEYQGKFDAALFNKVVKFQSVLLHFVNEVFVQLYNRSITKKEQLLNTQYLLMTAIYDELIDSKKIDEDALNEMFYHPEKVNTQDFHEKVLIHLHLTLLNEVPDKTKYWETIHQIHIAQKKSSKQFSTQIQLGEIIEITLEKGGYSLLMCRHYMQDPISNEVDKCWYALGGLIQMTNDLYDTFKDSKEGIQTFANTSGTISDIASIYQYQKMVLNKAIAQLPMSSFAKSRFAIRLALIPSFGDLAIEQISNYRITFPIFTNINSITRKHLIIDMEKTINKIRLIYFSYKNGNKWK